MFKMTDPYRVAVPRPIEPKEKLPMSKSTYILLHMLTGCAVVLVSGIWILRIMLDRITNHPFTSVSIGIVTSTIVLYIVLMILERLGKNVSN